MLKSNICLTPFCVLWYAGMVGDAIFWQVQLDSKARHQNCLLLAMAFRAFLFMWPPKYWFTCHENNRKKKKKHQQHCWPHLLQANYAPFFRCNETCLLGDLDWFAGRGLWGKLEWSFSCKQLRANLFEPKQLQNFMFFQPKFEPKQFQNCLVNWITVSFFHAFLKPLAAWPSINVVSAAGASECRPSGASEMGR